jgi:apolipoprotein N-acyltransferase
MYKQSFAGYFMTELLTITLAGSVLGVAFGFLMDFGVTNWVFSSYKLPNLWFGPIVFVAFFVLSFVFGLWPMVKVSKMTPAKALSPIEYNGLTIGVKRKSMSRRGLAWRIASRSMYRRQKASIRLVVLLSIVFVLLTISVAGGIIAKDTTTSWVQNTLNSNTIAIATNKMGTQYEQLLSKFSDGSINADFNYSESNLAIPQSVIAQLRASSNVALVDSRLVLSEHVLEINNFTVDQDTEAISAVGGNRQGNSIVVGVYPDTLDSTWSLKGDFLTANNSVEAVVGDSIAQTMYVPDPSLNIKQSNPLVQGIEFDNKTFQIVGVCVDPLNNGLVTYVPIDTLMKATGIASPNLLLVQLKDPSSTTITQIKTLVQSIDPKLNVFSVENAIQKTQNS